MVAIRLNIGERKRQADIETERYKGYDRGIDDSMQGGMLLLLLLLWLTSSSLQTRIKNRERANENKNEKKKRKAISENCLRRFISRSGKTQGQDAITFLSSTVTGAREPRYVPDSRRIQI